MGWYGISFNTASGKYYCNFGSNANGFAYMMSVSIPQAVSTIAIGSVCLKKDLVYYVSIPQAVSTIAIGGV